MKRFCFFAFALFLSAHAVSAAIIPVQQARSVISFGSASTFDESDSDGVRADAADFAPFEELVGHAARAGSATADGFAQQNSVIKPGLVVANLTADAFVGAFGVDDSADAGSSSNFELSFTVDEAALYHLGVSGSAANNGFASLQLDADPPSEVNYYFDVSFEQPPKLAILLEPGTTYRLVGNASASGFFSGGGGQPDGTAGLAFTLRQVPEPSSGALCGLLFAGAGIVVVRSRSSASVLRTKAES